VRKKKKNYISVTVGSVTLKIYPTPTLRRVGNRIRTYHAWTAVHHFGDRRIRRKYSDLEAAKRDTAKIAKDIAHGQTAAMDLTNADAAGWLRCKQLAAEVGQPPELLVAESVSGRKQLRGRATIERVIDDWVTRNPAEIAPRTVPDLVPDFIKTIEAAADAGELHIKDRRIRLERFARQFLCPVTAITGAELNTWILALRNERLEGKPLLGKRSRNNYRDALREFFLWCKRVKALPRDWSELDAVKPANIKRKGYRPVWTPEEMRLLLTAARDLHERGEMRDMIPYLAIGAFAGARSSELQRIRFEKINWDAGVIPLNYDETKTNERRLVPIQPNLADWLRPYEGKHGLICPYANPYDGVLDRIAQAAGLDWRKNALRYSSISYRLAITRDAAKVAEEHGNSEDEVKQTYQELVTEKSARAYYNITREDSNQKIMSLFGAPAVAAAAGR
jgi:integrase